MGRLRALFIASFQICCLLTVVANAQDQLQLGAPVERPIGPGETHVYKVTLDENTLIQIGVDQRGIDVVIKVASPDGKSLGEFDSPNGTDGPENVSFVALTAGAYSITVTPLSPSGVSPGRYQIKIVEQRQATDQELKQSKNQEVVKAKGIALLGEVDEIIPEIHLPQTRIRAQLQAAQLLWDSDEKRAAKYFADAIAGVKEFLAVADAGSPEYFKNYTTIQQLRYEITTALAARDPETAFNFMRSSKLPGDDPYGHQADRAAQESALELSIANELMRKDPKRTLQIARQTLKTKYSSNLISTVTLLRPQHPDLAAELANDIATKLLGEKLLKNPEAASLTVNLIQTCRAIPRRFLRAGGNAVTSVQAEPLLSTDVCHDLFEKALQEALSYSRPSPNSYMPSYTPDREAAWNILNGLQSLGADLDTILAGSQASVQKKLTELNVDTNPQQAVFQQFEATASSGTMEAAVEVILKAPEEVREQLYMQLANRAFANGDTARAKQIINDNISNPFQRRQALANLEQQELYQAMSKGKVEETLRAIANLRTPRERANMLMQMARQIGPGQKRATALSLLEQARSMLGPTPQAQDQDQMNALLEIARAFARYDGKRAFEMVEPLVDQFNELCSAARVLEGFGPEYYDDEELDLQNGNSVANMAIQLSDALGTLATINFERAKLASDRLKLPEVRLRAYLGIAAQTIQGSK